MADVYLVVENVLQAHYVGMSLTSAQQINFLSAINASRDDLDGEFLLRRFVFAASTDGEAAVAQHGFLQIDMVIDEERRILK